jgi:hypothetical protein
VNSDAASTFSFHQVIPPEAERLGHGPDSTSASMRKVDGGIPLARDEARSLSRLTRLLRSRYPVNLLHSWSRRTTRRDSWDSQLSRDAKFVFAANATELRLEMAYWASARSLQIQAFLLVPMLPPSVQLRRAGLVAVGAATGPLEQHYVFPCGGWRGGVPGAGGGCGWGTGVGCGWGIGEGWGRTGSNGGGRGGSPGRVGSLGFGMVTAYSFLSSPAIPKPAATRLPRRVRLARADAARTHRRARAARTPA